MRNLLILIDLWDASELGAEGVKVQTPKSKSQIIFKVEKIEQIGISWKVNF